MADKHIRQQVREAVKALLLDRTDAERRVFSGKADRVEGDNWPQILIMFSEESKQEEESVRDRESRAGKLNITGFFRELRGDDGEALLDRADDLALQVERAIQIDPKFGGIAKQTYYFDTIIATDGDGSSIELAITISYGVQYHTKPGQPETTV